MSAAFKNARLVATTTLTTMYTCPASTAAIVIGLQVANVDTANHNARVQWLDASNGNAVTRLLYDVSIPAWAAVGCIEGKLVLNAGDSIQAYSDVNNKLEYTLSVVEVSV